MSYKLAFDQAALQEWKALPDVVRAQFRAKMLERKEHPEIPKDRLSGEPSCFRIMFMDKRSVVHSDPEILGGTPVFVGTRVPVKVLFDYLEAGDNLEMFLDQFPSVSHEQAVAAIELARDVLLADAPLGQSPTQTTS